MNILYIYIRYIYVINILIYYIYIYMYIYVYICMYIYMFCDNHIYIIYIWSTVPQCPMGSRLFLIIFYT